MEEEIERLIFQGAPMSKNGTVTIEKIPLAKIRLNRNSRLNINPDELDGLMQSIKETGLLQPIGVVKNGSGYEICYGNRRFLACSKLGITKIPAIVHEKKSESDVDIKNLTENVQRRSLSLVEVGRYIKLLEKEGLTQRESAVRLGTTVGYVHAAVNAFDKVPKEFQNDIDSNIKINGGKTSRHVQAGKISITVASKIISAQKSGKINTEQAKKLFRAAKVNSDFQPTFIPQYIKVLQEGHDNFVEDAPKLVSICLTFHISEKHRDELQNKYCGEGTPFRSVQQLMYSILKGEKAVHIKMSNR